MGHRCTLLCIGYTSSVRPSVVGKKQLVRKRAVSRWHKKNSKILSHHASTKSTEGCAPLVQIPKEGVGTGGTQGITLEMVYNKVGLAVASALGLLDGQKFCFRPKGFDIYKPSTWKASSLFSIPLIERQLL